MIFFDLASKSMATVFFGLTLKSVATVSPGLTLKLMARVPLFWPQNRQLQFSDLSLKIITTVFWFGS
jgi:hypothetical protein